ncbi:unnamed protein product [Gadus morhua 'NCC']
MSLNKISSALLPWFLCLSFLPVPHRLDNRVHPHFSGSSPLSLPSSPEPATHQQQQQHAVLSGQRPRWRPPLLQLPSAGAPLRLKLWLNFSALPQRLTHRAAPCWPERAQRSGDGVAEDTGLLQDLLNGSRVSHLQLVSCGGKPLNSQHLALLGLLTLKIHSSAQGAPSPRPGAVHSHASCRVLSSSSSVEELEEERERVGVCLRLTFLDVALLTGCRPSRRTVWTGQSLYSLETQFPRLPLALLLQSAATPTPWDSTGSHDQVRDPDGEWGPHLCLLTAGSVTVWDSVEAQNMRLCYRHPPPC